MPITAIPRTEVCVRMYGDTLGYEPRKEISLAASSETGVSVTAGPHIFVSRRQVSHAGGSENHHRPMISLDYSNYDQTWPQTI
jgi:hypothetical protein